MLNLRYDSQEARDMARRISEVMRDTAYEASIAVSYTHLRAHETVLDLVCRLLLEKKNKVTLTPHVPP